MHHARGGHTARFLAAVSAALLALGVGQSARAESQLYGGFPEIDPSPRSVGLGGNLVALASGAEAMGSNPAGLLEVDRREVAFAYADLFGLGLVSHSAAQLAWPILGKEVEWEHGEIRSVRRKPPADHALGLAVTNLSTDIEPDRYDETQLSLGYATRALAGFLIGVDYRFLWAQSNLEDFAAQGHSIDLGVKRHWKALTVGAAARNFSSGVNWERGLDEPLARRVQIAIAYRPITPLVAQATADWIGDSLTLRASTFGAELSPLRALVLRGSIRQREDAIDTQTEWSAGASLSTWRLRFSYGITDQAQDLGQTQRWSGSFEF